MTTSTISNTIKDSSGTPLYNVPVVVDLVPGPAFKTLDGGEIESTVETDTDVNGRWSLPLEQSSNIDPSTSYYRVREMIPQVKGGTRTWFFRVPGTNAILHDCLVAPSVANAIVRPTIVTSTTRPSTPFVGQIIFETDTGKVLYYYGSTVGWQPAWNSEWGEVANIQMTSPFTTQSTSYVDVPALTNNSLFTAVAGRRYLTTINCWVAVTGGVGNLFTRIVKADGSTIVRDQAFQNSTATAWLDNCYYESRNVETAGVQGRRFQINVSVGTVTGQIDANASHPANLTVYDVGPSAAPVIT